METESISSIIRAGAECGVAKLKFGDVEVTYRENFLFSASQNYLIGPTENADLTKEDLITPLLDSGHSQESKATHKGALVDRDLLDNMRLSQLMIDDPLGFEQAMINAEMGRTDGEGS